MERSSFDRDGRTTYYDASGIGFACCAGLGVGCDGGGVGEEGRQELREGEDALEVEGEELGPGMVRVC